VQPFKPRLWSTCPGVLVAPNGASTRRTAQFAPKPQNITAFTWPVGTAFSLSALPTCADVRRPRQYDVGRHCLIATRPADQHSPRGLSNKRSVFQTKLWGGKHRTLAVYRIIRWPAPRHCLLSIYYPQTEQDKSLQQFGICSHGAKHTVSRCNRLSQLVRRPARIGLNFSVLVTGKHMLRRAETRLPGIA
jgi:hypothetical protein